MSMLENRPAIKEKKRKIRGKDRRVRGHWGESKVRGRKANQHGIEVSSFGRGEREE